MTTRSKLLLALGLCFLDLSFSQGFDGCGFREVLLRGNLLPFDRLGLCDKVCNTLYTLLVSTGSRVQEVKGL